MDAACELSAMVGGGGGRGVVRVPVGGGWGGCGNSGVEMMAGEGGGGAAMEVRSAVEVAMEVEMVVPLVVDGGGVGKRS